MSRGMTTAASTAAQSEVVARTVALKLEFDSAPVLLAGTPHNITIGGDEYLGVGAIGEISTVEEGSDLASYSITARLKGLDSSDVALALTEPYQNRPGTLYEVLFDRDTGELVADPVVIFRGRMNQMNISVGSTGVIELSIKNRLSRWERAANRRYTNADQQRDYPNDTFFDQVSATTEKEIIWPGKNYW